VAIDNNLLLAQEKAHYIANAHLLYNEYISSMYIKFEIFCCFNN
jgi:hypothetical protein